MQDSLSNLFDNLSEINNKKPKNKFIDNVRSMVFSLSQSVDEILEIERKISQIDKKESKNKFIDNMRSMVFSLSQSIDKISEIDRRTSHAALIEKFPNTYQLCNKDRNKFALLLRKGVYPYEYMHSWNKFNVPVPLIEDHYYSELNKEGITKEDIKHVKKVCDTFKIKNLGEYYDLYVQSNTALLADVFENFRYKCIERYELDPARFLSAPGLAWKASLKKTNVKLELLADNDMLLMFEKGISG